MMGCRLWIQTALGSNPGPAMCRSPFLVQFSHPINENQIATTRGCEKMGVTQHRPVLIVRLPHGGR